MFRKFAGTKEYAITLCGYRGKGVAGVEHAMKAKEGYESVKLFGFMQRFKMVLFRSFLSYTI